MGRPSVEERGREIEREIDRERDRDRYRERAGLTYGEVIRVKHCPHGTHVR